MHPSLWRTTSESALPAESYRPRPSLLARLRVAATVFALFITAMFPLSRLTSHAGEAILLLMPPALGAMLWFGWPRVRRTPWWEHALYPVVLIPVLAAAELVVAYVAQGRLLPVEVFWAVYFVIAWRLAWAVWSRTVGSLGERWRRWGRLHSRHQARKTRRQGATTEDDKVTRSQGDTVSRRAMATATLLVRPARLMLTLFIFVPLAFGSLIHRFKIGNPVDLGEFRSFHVEPAVLHTDDGLTLAGWFVPEAGSDSTVIICHGAGANKYNFLDFVRVFRYHGYSSLIFDFRGHGASDGHTSTFGLYEDADVKAAVDWLQKNRPTQSRHIYGLGSSMGAMSLVRQAAKDSRIEAVVLDSCFASAPLLAQQHLGRIPLLGRPLANMVLASLSLHAGRSFWSLDATKAIAALSPRPVLLIHGKDDVIIPPANMDILYDRARQPKEKWLGPGPHSNIMTADFIEYQRRVIGFLDKARSHVHDDSDMVDTTAPRKQHARCHGLP